MGAGRRLAARRFVLRAGAPPTPSEAQISYVVESVDMMEYPAVDYLVGWHIEGQHRKPLHVIST